jgi:hypothetical protein
MLKTRTGIIDFIFRSYVMTSFTPNSLYYYILKYTEIIEQ